MLEIAIAVAAGLVGFRVTDGWLFPVLMILPVLMLQYLSFRCIYGTRKGHELLELVSEAGGESARAITGWLSDLVRSRLVLILGILIPVAALILIAWVVSLFR